MGPRFAPLDRGGSVAVGASTHVDAGPEQISIPCAFMRGGSSRGGFFLESDLPRDPARRHAFLLAAYGSPDERQIDGIGGSDPLTSTAAVVARSGRPDADVEYTFYQVGIDRPAVASGGSCGNMLAAVGPFAILKGLVAPQEPETIVRIYTTNTRQTVIARVPVRSGLPSCEGDCAIAGVPGTGAAIRLDFGDCSGAASGKLLPTGAARDVIAVDGLSVNVSLIDAATPFVFVNARDIGGSALEMPDELSGNAPLMRRLELVRGWAAVVLGLVTQAEQAKSKSPNLPRVMMVASPAAYSTRDGRSVAAADVDICVRQLAMQRPHKALAVTGAVCAAVAASVPGSVVAEAIGRAHGEVRLGHPSGVLRVASRVAPNAAGDLVIRSAQIERTARLIMDGALFVRCRKIDELAASLRGNSL
jgi:2-methylaconitate cis-trans-isomerase PrpF